MFELKKIRDLQKNKSILMMFKACYKLNGMITETVCYIRIGPFQYSY